MVPGDKVELPTDVFSIYASSEIAVLSSYEVVRMKVIFLGPAAW